MALNQSQTWGELLPVFPVTSSGGALSIDLSAARVFSLILTENVGAFTITQVPPLTAQASVQFVLYAKQDATGGYLITWPGSVTWLGGSAPAQSTAAFAVDVYEFISFNGTSWYGSKRTATFSGSPPFTAQDARDTIAAALTNTSSVTWSHTGGTNISATVLTDNVTVGIDPSLGLKVLAGGISYGNLNVLTAPSDGQILSYDLTSDKMKWITNSGGYTDAQAVSAVAVATADTNSINFTNTSGVLTYDVRLNGSTLAIGTSGLSVATGGITSNELAANAVINGKILDSTIAEVKLDILNLPANLDLLSWDNVSGKMKWIAAPSTTPTGPAGGSLSGTYPNPSIASSAITPANLSATNSPTDTYLVSYDLATGKFTWVSPSAGGYTDAQAVSAVTTATADTNSINFTNTAGVLTYDVRLNGSSLAIGPSGLSVNASGVTAGTYGDSTHSLQLTVGADGRVTAVTAVAIAGSGQSAIQFKDEGTNIGTSGAVTVVNFVGAGVAAAEATGTVTVTIPDWQSKIQFKDEGSSLGTSGAITSVNFTGAGVVASYATNVVTVTIQDWQSKIQFKDEGTSIGTLGAVTAVNFTGAGVTASETGGVVTVDIPGGGTGSQAGIQFQDEGSNLGTSGTVDTINVTGAGVSASRVGNLVTFNVPGASGSSYVAATDGMTLSANVAYYVGSAVSTLSLPSTSLGTGDTITLVKSASNNVTINSSITIDTDRGSTTSIVYDATAEITFVYNGTTWRLNFTAAGTGSAGTTTTLDTYANRPTSPTQGDVHHCTDAPAVLIRKSGAWKISCHGQIVTPPDDTTFSWLNQGSATTSAVGPYTFLYDPATNAGSHFRYRAVPSTPYTVTAGFLVGATGLQYSAFGLGWLDATPNANVVISISACNPSTSTSPYGRLVAITKFSSPTTYVADYSPYLGDLLIADLCWLRVSDDGTNRKAWISGDGQSWVQIHSVARTDYLTPSYIGYFVNAANTSVGAGVTLIHWKEQAPLSVTGTYSAATLGAAYSSDLTIAGGDGSYSNPRVTVGSLPSGLSLSIVGSALRLSGTPTAGGTYAFTAAVDSGDGQTATSAQSVSVSITSSRYWRLYIPSTESSGTSSGYVNCCLIGLQSVAGSTINEAAVVGGTCTQSSAYNAILGSDKAWLNTKYDGSLINGYEYWSSNYQAPAWWAAIDAGAGKEIAAVELALIGCNIADRMPKEFMLQTSSDGSSWTTVSHYTGQTGWTDGVVRRFAIPHLP